MRGTDMRVTVERARPINSLGPAVTRRRLDDNEALAASIALEGLRLPVLILPGGELLKGRRRVAAVEVLGWTTIQARVVRTQEEAVAAVMDGLDQDARPRTFLERVNLGLMIETLDEKTPVTGRDRTYGIFARIGPALGWSGSTYKRARVIAGSATSANQPAHVVETAQKAVELIDMGGLTVSGAYQRVRAAQKSKAVDNVGQDGLPVVPPPLGSARAPKARKLREDWIRAMAAQGYTSAQIGERLEIGTPGVKKIARDIDVVITADAALNRTQRKAADPNRAIEVALADLDALAWSLERLDPVGLDQDQVVAWAAALKEYARTITRVASKIKKEIP